MSTNKACVIKEGRVHHTHENQVYVEVTALSACASCSAKSACGTAESDQRIIEALKPDGIVLKPGEKVWINAHPRAGHRAVIIGYVIPFVLLMVVLIVAGSYTSELYAGLLALASLIPYYLTIYLVRGRMATYFTFTLTRKSEPA